MSERFKDRYWVLESSEGHGWKVVFCQFKPEGGREDGNWEMIKDGMEYADAVSMAATMNKRDRGE